jgi:hypothetical protein
MTPLTPPGSIEGISVASKDGAIVLGEGRGVLNVGGGTTHNDDSKIVGCGVVGTGVSHELGRSLGNKMLGASLGRMDLV